VSDYMTLAEYKAMLSDKGKGKAKKTPNGPTLEEQMAAQIALADIPAPVPEYRFHPIRRWRIDFAWPTYRLAAEVNGGTWENGRHNRGSSIAKEYEKLNHLALAGWHVLLFSTNMVKDGTAVQYLIDFFEVRQ
jgi:very-short-patch-repair endonuclease